jgi:hypothetical protein
MESTGISMVKDMKENTLMEFSMVRVNTFSQMVNVTKARIVKESRMDKANTFI